MKILFICSSFEPGRDGVGDYARRLSQELVRQGHEADILALHDRHLETEQLLDRLGNDGKGIEVLRLSSRFSWRKRMSLAKVFVQNCSPDWISLQFVLFGFQDKGLPFGLASRLKRLGRGRNWHIMFHELWVGMDCEASTKFRVLGHLQWYLIQSILRKLNPRLIHTHTQIYRLQLKKMGFEAQLLPLFGNIPADWQKLGSAGRQDGNDLRIVIFGGIHSGAPVVEFAEELARYSHHACLPVVVIFVGHNGKEQEHWISVFQQANLRVEVLGEQPAERLTEIFLSSTYGIVTTPSLLAEKSGVVAALREHHLSLLCVARQWSPRGIRTDALSSGLATYESGSLSAFLEKDRPIEKRYEVTDAGIQMVNDIGSIMD